MTIALKWNFTTIGNHNIKMNLQIKHEILAFNNYFFTLFKTYLFAKLHFSLSVNTYMYLQDINVHDSDIK